MRNRAFGLDINPDKVVLEMAIQFPQAKSSTTTLIGNEVYDTSYGIYNHNTGGEEDLYANVQMHWAEDCTSTSELYKAIDNFIEFQVTKLTGLSLSQYFELPRHMCVKIIESCKAAMRKEVKVTEDVINTLNKGS